MTTLIFFGIFFLLLGLWLVLSLFVITTYIRFQALSLSVWLALFSYASISLAVLSKTLTSLQHAPVDWGAFLFFLFR